MPMRSNNGRAAIYRKVWGWPLRSMRNAGLTITAVAVFGFVVVQVRALGEPEHTTTTITSTTSSSRGGWSTNTSSTSWRVVTSTMPRGATSGATTASAPPAPAPAAASVPADPTAQGLAAVDAFMRAWVNHPKGMSGQAWAAQLTDLVQPELLDRLKSVDPTVITSSAVTAAPALVEATGTVVTADVQTDTDKVRVVALRRDDGTWRVRSYDKAPR